MNNVVNTASLDTAEGGQKSVENVPLRIPLFKKQCLCSFHLVIFSTLRPLLLHYLCLYLSAQAQCAVCQAESLSVTSQCITNTYCMNTMCSVLCDE